MEVVKVTATGGKVIEREWLVRAESVHRQLRPHLPENYAKRMAEIFATGVEMWINRAMGCGVSHHRKYARRQKTLCRRSRHR
jgi:tRNA A37 N6-isopentenylltransferase MiaA